MSDVLLSPVLQRVFNFLDWKSRKVVRQVCRYWKDELDDIGLNVLIDNRLEGNAEFVSKSTLQQIHLIQIDNLQHPVQLKHPNEIHSAKISGKVEPIWLIKELLHSCGNLTELYLTGNFLISQEIANQKRVKRGSTIKMTNLKVLRIEFGLEECEKYIKLQEPQGNLGKLFSIWSSYKKNALCYMRKTIDANLTYLLNQIRSPVLYFLYISVDPMKLLDKEIPDENNYDFEWKRNSIEGFIDHHRSTLKRLYLPNYEGKNMPQLSCRMIPEELKTLEITLFQNDNGKPSFMEKLISSQQCLEEFRFDNNYEDVTVVEYKPLNFKQLFVSNSNTLRYIHLTLSTKEKDLLNGYTFQNCSNLETFILENSENPPAVRFTKFNRLPQSLKIIKISCAIIVEVEKGQCIELKNFSHLEILELFDIRIKPINLEALTKTTLICLMNALHCRHLNTLVLDFSNELLMIRDWKIVKALASLADPHPVDIYEPFHLLEIFGPNRIVKHFLDEPAVNRIHTCHRRHVSKGLEKCSLDQIIVHSNVYKINSSLEAAFESCLSSVGFGCTDPGSIEENIL